MLGREHATRRRGGVLVEDAARAVAHALHGVRRREPTACAERGVAVREVDEPHVAPAEREPEAVALSLREGRQPEAVRDLEERVEPERVQRPHRGHVQRGGESDAQR